MMECILIQTVFSYLLILVDFVELMYSMKESINGVPDLKRLSKVYRAFASRACRKSIMIGQALSQETMARIVANLSQLNQPWVSEEELIFRTVRMEDPQLDS